MINKKQIQKFTEDFLDKIYNEVFNKYDNFCDYGYTTIFYPELALLMSENNFLCRLKKEIKWLYREKSKQFTNGWINRLKKMLRYYEYLKNELEPKLKHDDILYERFEWNYKIVEKYPIRTEYCAFIKYLKLNVFLIEKNNNPFSKLKKLINK